jgi:hypothetical protein
VRVYRTDPADISDTSAAPAGVVRRQRGGLIVRFEQFVDTAKVREAALSFVGSGQSSTAISTNCRLFFTTAALPD